MGLEKVPMVVFAKGAWFALDDLCNMGYQVVGLDWLQDPAEAVKIRGNRKIVFQGNADPGILYGAKESISAVTKEMVEGFGGGKQGWIANLGHGKCSLLFLTQVANIYVGITPFVNPDDLKFYFEELHRLTT
jgi:uroporphyrinogen decarboxylase